MADQLRHAGDADPKRQTALDTLYDQAFRMQQLVVNLLDMARLQAGSVQLNSQWQLLEEVLGSALRAMQPVSQQHRILVALPADLPLLQFDAVLLERVFCNLIDNACKYSPPDTTIHISARVHQEEVWITVADEGQGLPAGMETQIFQKFARGQAESSKPGVGLGLSICKAIIQAHGGELWAEDAPPHGTRFIFSLPLGQPPAPPLAEDSPA